MGIKFKNLKYKNYINNLNLELSSNQVISVIGEEEKINNILDLMYGIELPDDGEILINRNIIDCNTNLKKITKIRKSIAYLMSNCEEMLFNINVLEDIKYGLNNINEKKLYELLELLNLDQKILSKNYIEISCSEKKKICIIATLLKDSKITILSNLTAYLDAKSIQNLLKFLRKEKRNNKLFIVTSRNSDFLLQVSDNVITVINDEIKLEKDRYEIFSSDKIMDAVMMHVPQVIKFKNKALEMKNIKLTYRDNINDLLKDIYRNA